LNSKTNAIVVTLNHGPKKIIVSPIYQDWIRTANTFQKQAERKELPEEYINIILDELDNNNETILDNLLRNGEKEELERAQTKEVYIRKYSGNGIPLSESIIIGGNPKFLQITDDRKPVLFDKLETGHKTFYPYDNLQTHNPIPYVFEPLEELNGYLKNAATNENLDPLYLKVKSVFKKYVDVEEKYIALLAASTILSYYQDKFGTIHYIIIVGDNGSGKNSALLVYRFLGYRVFYVTAASAANYYFFLGDEEEGQETLAEDEADNIHLQSEKYKIGKTGYASGGSVPKVDIHSGNGGGGWQDSESLPNILYENICHGRAARS
jgi:hypothetical protein